MSATEDISPDARQMMRNALGINPNNRVAFRNRYFLSAGSRAFVIWARLVKQGYAAFYKAREGQLHMFAVTTKGFNAIRSPGEKADSEEIADMRNEYDKHPSVGTDITLIVTEPTL